MRQITYTGALGSCALGGPMSPALAAEWSITPSYSATVDYDSNRQLLSDSKGSEAGVITADVLFKHAVENLDYSLEPRYAWRRYTDNSLGNGDDRSIWASLNWMRETSTLGLSASYWDQSTLTTELLETGIVTGDTHRRLGQAAVNWVWSQTERRSLLAQVSYMDVRYHGSAEEQLPGYRYPSGSLGERYAFSERGSLTVSAYGSLLDSDTKGNSSHSVGLQAELIYQFTERVRFDASLGESSRVLAGDSSRGTDAHISLTRTGELSRGELSYTRSLQPYGFGFLVEREEYRASYTQPLTPTMTATLSGFHIKNNETAVLLRLDRQSYNSVALSFNWRPYETWSYGAQIEDLRTQPPGVSNQTVQAWRASMSLTWTPHPISRSW